MSVIHWNEISPMQWTEQSTVPDDGSRKNFEKFCITTTTPFTTTTTTTTYLLTPWCRVLIEKLTGLQLVKKFPAFHGTPRFITALASVRNLSLSWASPIQSTYPHPTSWRSVLILSTHLRLGLPSGLFSSGFPTKTLHTPLSSPIRATCPAHLILLDFITRTILGEQYKSLSSSLCSLLHSPVTSSLLTTTITTTTTTSNNNNNNNNITTTASTTAATTTNNNNNKSTDNKNSIITTTASSTTTNINKSIII